MDIPKDPFAITYSRPYPAEGHTTSGIQTFSAAIFQATGLLEQEAFGKKTWTHVMIQDKNGQTVWENGVIPLNSPVLTGRNC
jgi:hypothetical protein